jgi:hypothetical protein
MKLKYQMNQESVICLSSITRPLNTLNYKCNPRKRCWHCKRPTIGSYRNVIWQGYILEGATSKVEKRDISQQTDHALRRVSYHYVLPHGNIEAIWRCRDEGKFWAVARPIIGGGGLHIHIFVFCLTDFLLAIVFTVCEHEYIPPSNYCI